MGKAGRGLATGGCRSWWGALRPIPSALLFPRVRVQRADVELLKEEHIENIVSGLGEGVSGSCCLLGVKSTRGLGLGTVFVHGCGC